MRHHHPHSAGPARKLLSCALDVTVQVGQTATLNLASVASRPRPRVVTPPRWTRCR